MADLSITAGNVQPGAGAVLSEPYLASVAITAGQSVFLNSSKKWALAQADDSATLGTGATTGIAANTAGVNQPLRVQSSGIITLGTATEGVVYAISAAAAGGIAPVSDITTGEFPKVLGIGKDGGGGLVMGVIDAGAATVQ